MKVNLRAQTANLELAPSEYSLSLTLTRATEPATQEEMLLMHGLPAENCPAGRNVNVTSMNHHSNYFQDTFPLIRTNTHSIVLNVFKDSRSQTANPNFILKNFKTIKKCEFKT